MMLKQGILAFAQSSAVTLRVDTISLEHLPMAICTGFLKNKSAVGIGFMQSQQMCRMRHMQTPSSSIGLAALDWYNGHAWRRELVMSTLALHIVRGCPLNTDFASQSYVYSRRVP
jgi:hypothetical protein